MASKGQQALMMQRRWQADPVLFMTEVLDVEREHVWSKMQEVTDSVRDNNKTCVYAGHSVSKSFTAARLALWFLSVFGPKATVITTAPSNDQVANILWREIAVAYGKSKVDLAGQLTKTKLDMGVNLEPPEGKWFAYGFATTPDTVTGEATRFQGYHNDHVLVIFDEAAGILPQIWRAANHLLTSEEAEDESVSHWRWLAIGNPTSPYGQFAECEDDPEWNCITVSVKDTPNFKQGKLVVPGLSGRKYEKTMRDKYGPDSNEYKIRICGKKPTFGEGTYYGKFMADAKAAGHMRDEMPIEQLYPVHVLWDPGRTHTAAVFVQLVDGWLRIIDGYYDDKGSGWSGHASVMQSKTMGGGRWNYLYGDHWGPDDLWSENAKNMSGEMNLILAKKAGIDFKKIMSHSFDDRIAATRAILPTKILFDMASPGVRMVVSALNIYAQRINQRESTDERPVYFKEPVKNWSCHVADAFGHLGIVYEYDGIKPFLPGFIERHGIKQSKPYGRSRTMKAIA